jgi:SNF2 family DNA or RNA helicase
MLKEGNKGLYVLPVTQNGEEIVSLEGHNNISDENKKIFERISEVKQDSFFSGWDTDETEAYLNENLEVFELLKDKENFVDKNFKRLIWKNEENKIMLSIREKNENAGTLKGEIVLENLSGNLQFVGDEYVYKDGIFYKITLNKKESFYSLADLESEFPKSYLEKYLSLAFSNFENLEIEYIDYKIEKGERKNPNPQLVIEKISQDNSLYLKLDTIISTINHEFLQDNNIEEIAVVNELERKIVFSTVNKNKLSETIEEVVKVLAKHQKNIGMKSGFYIDESNLLIIQEKLAKEFITKELLQLAAKYKVVGTDKLKKYNIKAVKPKVLGTFKHSIDFLEGNLYLEIEGEKFSIMDVISTYKKDSYVVLSDGTNALINKKYIERLERLFRENDGKKVKLSFFDLPLVDELIEDKVLSEQLNKSRAFYTGINNIKEIEDKLPKINATLREYQEYGYKWLNYLLENKIGGCLADDMGLGKTLQAITLITKLHQSSRRKKKSLVVMPKSLIYNWENEIKKFSPDLKCGVYYGNLRNTEVFDKNDVTLTTYGTIRNDIEQLKELKFDLVVLDESQNIKNINAQTTKAIMLLNTQHRIALSGTPIENNLSELYSLFRFLNPSMFGTLEEFNTFYATPIQRDNDKDAITELKKKIYPFILRRVKKDVLKDLPDKIEKTMFIEMTSGQKKIYEERRAYYYKMIHEQIKEKGVGGSQFYILQALNELRQITSCPEVKNDTVISGKREVLINNIIDAVENEHKVLIFTNYIKSIESICEDLEKQGIPYLSMTGATKDRQGLVDKFQNDKKYKVFIMTLKTGGVGLNLTAADTIFIYDPWWNKTVENQAVDRAYRLGQDRTVFAYKLIMKDSIEEKILKLQESKSQLLDSLISDDGVSVKSLTEKDIEFILGS